MESTTQRKVGRPRKYASDEERAEAARKRALERYYRIKNEKRGMTECNKCTKCDKCGQKQRQVSKKPSTNKPGRPRKYATEEERLEAIRQSVLKSKERLKQDYVKPAGAIGRPQKYATTEERVAARKQQTAEWNKVHRALKTELTRLGGIDIDNNDA